MNARWKILIAAGIFCLLIAVSMLFNTHFKPENEVEAYKNSLRARGEKLEISEVLPPPVAPEKNCADAVGTAFGLMGSGLANIPYTMQMVAPGKAMISWAQPEARGYDFTDSWSDFSGELETFQPALQMLREVLKRPELDFQLDYKKGFALLLPQLAAFKRSAQVLSAATQADLHNGDIGSATTNICISLALVRADENEATLISHLVRIAIVAINVSITWEFLQATNTTDAQLAAVQKNWEQLEFFDAAEKSFLMERAMLKDGIEKARNSNEEFEHFVGSASSSGAAASGPMTFDEFMDNARLIAGKVMWRASWSYSEEVHMLQGDQIVLETLRTMKTNQFLKPDYDLMLSRLSSVGLTNIGEIFFDKLKIPDFNEYFDVSYSGSAIAKTIRIEAARRVVVTAIALKRFQLRHGKFPEKISELAPEFFQAVPIDPYDGKPLKYHPNADGTYLLYCVGEDGTDDGGDPTWPVGIINATSGFYWQNSYARDWVWPQPATAAEIKYFYEHPPK